MIIDAKNKVLGRIATTAAKKALLGEIVHIINVEQAIITGKKESVFAHYFQKRNIGHLRGPFISRLPDKFVRRAIRGMLPYKQPKGVAALKKIRCYTGVPPNLKEQKGVELKNTDISKLPNFKYVTVKQLCDFLGGKQ